MASDPDVGEMLAAAIGGLGPLARRLNQLHTRLWYEQVDQDLTGPQFTVLSLLEIHGDLDQGTLGSLAHLDKSTTAPLLDRLRRRGLVEITKDDADKRRKRVRLTAEGREAAQQLGRSVISVSDQMLAALDAEEREQFLALLHRVLQDAPPERAE